MERLHGELRQNQRSYAMESTRVNALGKIWYGNHDKQCENAVPCVSRGATKYLAEVNFPGCVIALISPDLPLRSGKTDKQLEKSFRVNQFSKLPR